jgi:hypothetical protein
MRVIPAVSTASGWGLPEMQRWSEFSRPIDVDEKRQGVCAAYLSGVH